METKMKRLLKIALLAGVAATMLSSTKVLAQGPGGGGFDPAQMQQMMMDRYKEALAVTDDSEWKVISAAIEKVTTARRESGGMGGGMGGMMGMGRRRGGQDAGGQDAAAGGGRRGGGRGGMFGTPLPEQTALQEAIDSNASGDVLKTKLAALRTARAAKQAALEKAQDDLKKLLNTKQEAVAYTLSLVR